MSITRITEFEARNEDSSHRLRDLISNGLAVYEASKHCHSCQLLRDHEDQKTFVVIEVWDNIEARNASAKNIPADVVKEVVKLSSGPPYGRTFTA